MRIGWPGVLIASALTGATACVQMFGLDSYTDQRVDGGADASSGVEPEDATSADAGATGDAGGSPAADGDAGAPGDAAAEGPTFALDACTGSNACAPLHPTGWQGPVVFWTGSGGAPACPGYFVLAFDGGTSLSAPPAQCTCSCGNPSGGTCGAASAQFGTASCGTSCGPSGGLSLVPGACTSAQSYATACGAGADVTVSGSTARGASCQPGGSVVVPPMSWGTLAIACSPTAESPLGCPTGEECVPAAPPPFEGNFCVFKPGTNACPAGAYSVQRFYYASVGDTRGCSRCTCGNPTGMDCNANAHVETFAAADCGASPADLGPLPVGCTPAGGALGLRLTATPGGGSCTPGGGQPNGNATPQALTTICCIP